MINWRRVIALQCLEIRIPPLPQTITIGHSFWKPGMIHFRRTFPIYDLLFVKSGKMFITEDETPYEINGGGMLVLEPDKPHWGHHSCTDITEVYWVHLKHEAPLRICNSEEIQWSTVLRQGRDHDWEPVEQSMFLPKFVHADLERVFVILDELFRLHNQFMLDVALQLHGQTAALLQALQNIARFDKPSRTFSISERVAIYLQQSMCEPSPLNEIERSLNYDIDYLSRCFKQHAGITPLQYLHHLRLERAKSMLANTDLPLKTIAQQIGIDNYNYFHRLFRMKIGVAPGLYREQLQRKL
jgi:AraC-like DNA-binding protein